VSKDKQSAAARTFEDEDPTAAAPEVGSIESLTAGVDGLIEEVAAAEAADPRTKLQFVQFKVAARLNGRAGAVPVIARTKGTRIFIDTVAGIPCVIVEGPAFPKRACVPMENVAVFSVFT